MNTYMYMHHHSIEQNNVILKSQSLFSVRHRRSNAAPMTIFIAILKERKNFESFLKEYPHLQIYQQNKTWYLWQFVKKFLA